jgi:hypothetical protein
MRRSREEILEWEARWRLPTAAASIGGVLLFLASQVAIGGLRGDGSAEFLREADAHSSTLALSGALQVVAFLCVGVALVYLFRAAAARSEKMLPQLVGLFIAAPLFLAVSAGLTPVVTGEAADEFVAGEAKPSLTMGEASKECGEEREDEGAKDFASEHDGGSGPLADCTATKLADDAAEDAISDAGLRGIYTGLQLAGLLGLAFCLLYGCLNAMRVGLLTRFWGSLGMALGVAGLLGLILFTLAWFLYFGLLVAGWIPGGRPPAWAEGKAIPWPTPGEKVAEELQPGDAVQDSPESADPSEPRRKRKQRGEDSPE